VQRDCIVFFTAGYFGLKPLQSTSLVEFGGVPAVLVTASAAVFLLPPAPVPTKISAPRTTKPTKVVDRAKFRTMTPLPFRLPWNEKRYIEVSISPFSADIKPSEW
jgi:hypothetical protein